ncbi:polymer-forming cytoskeletal protein [Salmonella enterica]|nr:polymer-forming cytoskeletal protein [Salmonella enterica]EHW8353114.1 polymer-forming cytoskeletal protein [Salmonella enterica]
MFAKKKEKNGNANLIDSKNKTGMGSDSLITLIGSGAIINGDLFCTHDVNILGKITGNVKINHGEVHVLQGGHIIGDVHAETIEIDGIVEGVCQGQNITIQENGKLIGTCRSNKFSIITGGEFVGTSEEWVESLCNSVFELEKHELIITGSLVE